MSPRAISILLAGVFMNRFLYNDESPNDEGSPNVRMTKVATSQPLSFGFGHSFVIRHSPFVTSSRSKPLNLPTAIRLSRVTKTIVQPVRTPLPEFHCIRFKPITAPVRGQRNRLVLEAFGHFCHARIKHATRVDHIALTRCPGAQLAAHRARVKIRL